MIKIGHWSTGITWKEQLEAILKYWKLWYISVKESKFFYKCIVLINLKFWRKTVITSSNCERETVSTHRFFSVNCMSALTGGCQQHALLTALLTKIRCDCKRYKVYVCLIAPLKYMSSWSTLLSRCFKLVTLIGSISFNTKKQQQKEKFPIHLKI